MGVYLLTGAPVHSVQHMTLYCVALVKIHILDMQCLKWAREDAGRGGCMA